MIGIAFALVAASAAQSTALPIPVLPAVAKSILVGPMDPTATLHVAVSLPPQNQKAFQQFADSVSNPKSASYRHFITPAQVGALFGPSISKVAAVGDFLRQNGFTIKLVAQNHMAILADCSVAQAERAFGVSINKYHDTEAKPLGRVDFYAYNVAPSVPARIAPNVLAISGLENFTMPHHKILTPTEARSLYDIAPFYNAGLTGVGRTIAISNWDGYRLSNVPLWYSTYNLPTPSGGVGSNITVVTIDGGSGAGSPFGEGDLDIQMELGQAPLAHLLIYDSAGDPIDTLTKEADDNLADAISESYGWTLPESDVEACHNQHLALSAQGITYMVASGDDGTSSYDADEYVYPDTDSEILNVGGTIATVDGKGARATEVGWNGSGGGWTTDPSVVNVRPPYESVSICGFPNVNYHLIPDVAGNAWGDPAAYWFYYSGVLSAVGGTSCASPIFTGELAIAESQLIALGLLPPSTPNGPQRLGRIDDLLYQAGSVPNVFYDVTVGDNGVLPDGSESVAGPGWDTVTGLGCLDWGNFVNYEIITATPFPDAPQSVSVYNGQGGKATGTVGNIVATDGIYYSVPSVEHTGLGQIAAAQITFAASHPTANILRLRAQVVANAPTDVTEFVYMLNYTTGNYDLVGKSPMTTSDGTVNFVLSSVSNYISTDGNETMSMVVRGVTPTRLGELPFVLNVDSATILETVSKS